MCPRIQPRFDQESHQAMKEGDHVCRIVESELRAGRETGNQYVSWKLQTEDDGRTVYYNTMIEGKAAGMFKHFVHCAGDELYESGEFDTDLLHGKKVVCTLGIREVVSQGIRKTVYEVRDVIKPSSMSNDDDVDF